MKRIFLLLFLITPVCKGQNIEYTTVDLDSIFSGNRGTFVLYDYSKDKYEIYNHDQAATAFPVASTSKIFWSIVGLEEHIIKSENDIVKWDSVKYPRKNLSDPSWAGDQTIVTALHRSVNWYYFELLSSITPEMAQKYLIKLNYKPDYKVERVHYFGFASTVKKSALEQIAFLKDLYLNKFQISDKTLNIVKKGLVWQTNDKYTLYAKTGLSPVDKENKIGWFIGFVVKGDKVYFFASNVENRSFEKARELCINCALKSLRSLGII